jgi:hypothetical protein
MIARSSGRDRLGGDRRRPSRRGEQEADRGAAPSALLRSTTREGRRARRCEALGASWADAPCPEANVVATCTNAWDEEVPNKFYPPTTRAEAAALCTAGKGEVR